MFDCSTNIENITIITSLLESGLSLEILIMPHDDSSQSNNSKKSKKRLWALGLLAVGSSHTTFCSTSSGRGGIGQAKRITGFYTLQYLKSQRLSPDAMVS